MGPITPGTAKVGSSCRHMRGPGIGCWFSDRSNSSHWSLEAAVLPINTNIYTDLWEHIVIYQYITLLLPIQLCSPCCWHLELLSYKLKIIPADVCTVAAASVGDIPVDIPLFTLIWAANHSPNRGCESTHRLHLTEDVSPHTGYTFTPLPPGCPPPPLSTATSNKGHELNIEGTICGVYRRYGG